VTAPSKNIAIDGLICAAVTFLTWGMVGIWVRLLHIPSLFIVGVRMSIAFFCLLPFVLLSPERRAHLPRTLRMPSAWILAGAMIAYYALAVAAFQYGTVAEVALFVGISPAFILVTRIARRQPISRRETIGAMIAIVGVIIVLGPKLSFNSPDTKLRILGDVLALASASMSALYAGTFRAIHESGNEAPDTICVAVLASAIGGSVLTVTMSLLHPGIWEMASGARSAAILLVLGVVSTAVPSVTYAIASRKLPAILSTTSQLMIPVVSTIAAAFILHELPPLWVYLGGVLILYGIIHMFRQDAPPYVEGEAPLAD
jgi:drug/metabolite transporter, DME family